MALAPPAIGIDGIVEEIDKDLGKANPPAHDLDLADVCYSGHIADVLDNNKVVDIDDGKALDIEFSPTHYSTPTRFTRAFNFMRTQPQLIPVYDAWQQE